MSKPRGLPPDPLILKHFCTRLRAIIILTLIFKKCWSQWPCGLRRGSAAARLLGLWVRILPRAWMSVCCECCVLSGRGLCDGLVPRPKESYRVWCVSSMIVKPRKMRRPRPQWAVEPLKKNSNSTSMYSVLPVEQWKFTIHMNAILLE
jgi:hypothetical protein